MKTKILALVLVSFLISSFNGGANSNKIYVKKKADAITDGSLYFMNPRWSPDGKKLAFTESKYQGIWILDLKSGDFTQITDEPGAGFGFRWSRDSQEILCRVSKQENYRRYHTVKIFNLTTSNVQQLTDYRSLMTGLPHWFEGDRKVYLASNKGLEVFEIASRATLDKKSEIDHQQRVCYATEHGFVIHKNNGSVVTTKPVDGTYLNAEISPDGEKVAYEVMGGNMYVMDLETEKTKDLGIGYFPQWSPDSKKLTYMISEDDGHQFVKSDIFVIEINGNSKQNLTNTKTRLEQHPSWSPDGKKIVFDELTSGKIFIIEIGEKINKIRQER